MAELSEGSILGHAQPEPADGGPEDDRPRGRAARWLVLTAALVLVAGAAVAIAVPEIRHSELTLTGVDDGARLNRSDSENLEMHISSNGFGAGDVTVTLDGLAVVPVRTGDVLIVRPGALADGEHTITVELGGRFGASPITETRSFSVDASGPSFTAPAQVLPAAEGGTIVVSGLTDGAVVSLTVDGVTASVVDGAYRADLSPTTGQIEVVATDATGNTTTRAIDVTAAPTPSSYPATNSVHVGQSAWADPARRAAILELARSGQIDAVQLDIKDEVGDLGYPSAVPLAATIGAKMDFYDARDALDELHAAGVRVIGRIVCFLDPTLARWALANGQPDYLVHDATGVTPLPSDDYGDAAFVNFSHPDVQQYQIDLAIEAVGLGFDEIIYDYVRRPEGDLGGMTFPGLTTSPEVGVARFVERSAAALDPIGAELGVSVFGISATRPREIAQDIRLLAPLVDYVSPMVYPEVWADGEYGVADPYRQPYDIVVRALADFQRLTAGSGAAVVPWLQDYSVGSFEYTEPEITAQLQAARDSGSNGYLMWNPRALYHWPAIVPIAPPAAS